ncbi:MAG: Ig-like domain-containing protein [Bacteroidales bacterium]
MIKRLIVSFTIILLSSILTHSALAQSMEQTSAFPEDAWGVYSWASYSPNNVSREKCPNIKGAPLIMRWSNLEPENGKFEFKKEIGDKLELLDQNDFNTFLMVWVAFATSQVSETDTSWAFTPKWLFKNGVPLVEMEETINPLGVKTRRDSPYYFDEDYIFFFHRMIDSLGNYICNLPPHLKKRILFLQSAEGSTGDGGPYKGSPVNPIYNITKAQWSQFRIETWEKYKSAFTRNGELQLPLLTNYDSNEEAQYRWMLDSLPKALGLKNGMFSHGYHISDAQERLANFIQFRNDVEATGKTFFARGEQDAEYKTYGWSTQNIKQGLYWSSIYATHCGLSMWNVPGEACQGETYSDAIHFFNRYAAETNPANAKGAFCALRRGLDAFDTESFPEDQFGTATKNNTQRYIAIANEMSGYGANQGDPEKATGGGMVNRKRQDYNDVGWQILPSNYQRHITQIDPEETSIAWWQVDRSIYGRFARGFDVEKGMNTMFFDVDDKYFEGNREKENGRLKVRIIYRSGDGGSWELLYHAKDGTMKSACIVNNDVNRDWLTREVIINDALLDNGGPKGADLILQNLGNTNCRFHMIELERDLVITANDSIKITNINIENCSSELIPGSTHQLTASVFPADAGNQTITWSSSNTDIATVDQWGLVNAIANGSAVIVATSNDGSFTDTCFFNIGTQEKIQFPFGGTNHVLPGLIEAEHFDIGGEGIAYHDVTEPNDGDNDLRAGEGVDLVTKENASNGISTAHPRNGEWLEYTVDVSEGTYDIVLYYFCPRAHGDIEVSLDGNVICTFSDFKIQEDLDMPDSVIVKNIYLPEQNDQILRLENVNGGNVFIDAIKFSPGEKIEVTDVAINSCPSEILNTGKTYRFFATLVPEDASKRGVSWSSSNPEVAAVDENGLTTAISAGTAIITVTSDGGGLTDMCELSVISPVDVNEVSLNNCPEQEIKLGDSHQLSATVYPADATNKQIIWSTFDASKATVDMNGLVTTLSEGSVIISVSAPGGFSDQCTVNVYKPYIAVTSIGIEGCSDTELLIGHTRQLTAQVEPSDATDHRVLWSSSDNQLATVNEDGLINAVSEGMVTITATSIDGGFTEVCEIAVSPVPVSSLELGNCPTASLNIGNEHPLRIFVSPVDAGDKSVTWTTSDPLVATVDPAGVITAISEGNATITATSNDGNFTDECLITVADTATSNSAVGGLTQNGVKVYPNPVWEKLNFEFSEGFTEKTISLYNIYGQLLITRVTSDSSMEFNISEISNEEFLIVKIVSQAATSSFRVICGGEKW